MLGVMNRLLALLARACSVCHEASLTCVCFAATWQLLFLFAFMLHPSTSFWPKCECVCAREWVYGWLNEAFWRASLSWHEQ